MLFRAMRPYRLQVTVFTSLSMLSQMLQTELGISGNEDAEASKVF
jgi:hypothetical protein